MTQVIDIDATKRALLDAGIDPEPGLAKDPNTRRLIQALCVRHNVPPVFKELTS